MELDVLATTGAVMLVQAATTDAWNAVSRQVARLLGRSGQNGPERVDDELAQTRNILNSPHSGDSVAFQEELWAMRLDDLLAEHPERRQELQSIVDAQKVSQSNIFNGPTSYIGQNSGTVTNNFGIPTDSQ